MYKGVAFPRSRTSIHKNIRDKSLSQYPQGNSNTELSKGGVAHRQDRRSLATHNISTGITLTGVGAGAAVGVVVAIYAGGMYTYSGVLVLDYRFDSLAPIVGTGELFGYRKSMPLLYVVVKQLNPSYANRTASSHKFGPF